MEKEWYHRSSKNLDIEEVEAAPEADTRNGHALQFFFSRKTSLATTRLIDLTDALNYGISEVVSANWVAGSGSVEIVEDNNKELEVDGQGCVNIVIKDKSDEVRLAVQIDTSDIANTSGDAWEGDELTLDEAYYGTVYRMAGNPCAWVCSNAAGVHTTDSYGTVNWHDRYRFYKPLVVGYEVVDSTAGELIDAETATAAELGVFKAYAGKVISQRCRVTAGSGDFKVNGYPATLYAYPDGSVEVESYARSAYIAITATTAPKTYNITPDSAIVKTIAIGDSLNVNELYEYSVKGGDGKVHLRAVLSSGAKQISLDDADGLGTVTGKATGVADININLVADTSGDYEAAGSVTIVVEEVTVTITGHDRTMRTGKSRALEKFFTVESNTDNLTRSYEWEDAIGTGVAEVTGDKLKALVAGGVGALRLHIKATKTGALFNGLCVVKVADDTGTGCIVIGSDVWEDEDDPIYVGDEAVKAVYVCDEDGNLHQVYG